MFPWDIVYGHYNWYTYKHILLWNNTKTGKIATFHIHVKSEPGYSPKYQENIFSVVGLSLRRNGLNNKLRQFIKCDGRDSWIVAMYDCRNLWRFKIQLFRLMSIVPKGILMSAESMFKSTSDPIKKVSLVHKLWVLQLISIRTNRFTSEITPKWAKMQIFIFMRIVSILDTHSAAYTWQTFY